MMRYIKTILVIFVATFVFDTENVSAPKKDFVFKQHNFFKKKRLIIKFSSGTPLYERKAFFVEMKLTPVEFDVFGYDIGETGGYVENLSLELNSLKKNIFSKGFNILDYQIEEQEKRLIPEAGCLVNNPDNQMENNLVIPWYGKKLQIAEAYKLLVEKKEIFWPQGIIVIDNGPAMTNKDIAPVIKNDGAGKPIFWARNVKNFKARDHGTHVACLAAGYNDRKGVDGIAPPNTYILPLIINYSDNNDYFSSDIAIGLKYFKELEDRGEISWRVVNMSLTMTWDSHIVRAAIKYLSEKLFVVAAGNEKMNLDEKKIYPASWLMPNVIAVAATEYNDKLAGFSNYGAKSASIAAPGVNVESCLANGGFASWDGTSMATPLVAGTLQLLFSTNPSFTANYVKIMLLNGAKQCEFLKDKVASERRLNVFGAVKQLYVNY